MKVCSVKSCTELHDTKYKMCTTCREYVRSFEQKTRNGLKYQIKVIAEQHQSEDGCNKILKLLTGNENADQKGK